MAAYFFDSSALVKRYVIESGAKWVSSLCDPVAGHTLYIARIAGVEVISAFSRRVRMRDLTQATAQSAMAAFWRDFLGVYFVAELTPGLIERAMDLAKLTASVDTMPCNLPPLWKWKVNAAETDFPHFLLSQLIRISIKPRQWRA